MRAGYVVGLFVTIGIVYACGTQAHSYSMATAGKAMRGDGITNTTAHATGRKVTPTALESSMDVSVSGEDVHLVLHITNNTPKKLELTFPSGQTHDIVVVDAAGSEVWRWSTGQMFTQELRNQPLDSKGALSYSAHWRRPHVHGPLTAIATLTSSNYPLQSRATFDLP